MSGIEDLRQRVTDAEKRFGLISETHAKYSGQLISLMNAIEECIREQQGELAQQKSIVEQHLTENEQHKSTIARKEQDNEQLRTMLHSLLQAIEAGSNDLLADAMRQLDQRASALIGAPVEDETPAEASEDTPEAVEEAPEEPAAEDEMPAPEAEMTVEISEAPAEAVAERETSEIEDMAVADAAEPAAASEGAVEEVLFAPPNGAAPAPDAGGAAEAEGDSPAAEDEAAAMAETAVDADAQAEPPVAEGEDALPEGSLDEIMQRVSKLVEETNDAAAAGEDQAPAEEMASEAPAPGDEIAEDPPLDEAAAS